MPRLAIVAVLVALLSLAALPSATATQPHGAGYSHNGGDGILSFVGSNGSSYVARTGAGDVVAYGIVAGPEFSVSAPNAGPDSGGNLLYVVVGGWEVVFSVNGPDWIWE